MHELSLQYLPALPQAAFVPYCTRHFCFSGALCLPPPFLLTLLAHKNRPRQVANDLKKRTDMEFYEKNIIIKISSS